MWKTCSLDQTQRRSKRIVEIRRKKSNQQWYEELILCLKCDILHLECPVQVTLLDQKTSLNVNIFLKQFKMDNASIVMMISNGDSSKMSIDQLKALEKLLPDSSMVSMRRWQCCRHYGVSVWFPFMNHSFVHLIYNTTYNQQQHIIQFLRVRMKLVFIFTHF